MKDIFEKIAQENNTTAEEVEGEIIKLIDVTFENNNKPTPAELILFLADVVKKSHKDNI